MPDGREVVLADTVGFIRDLPHELIAAFQFDTLQEAREADLILHLIDASDENRWQRVRQVNAVLKELDADRVPQIRVYNKIDKLGRKPRVTNNRAGEGRAVWLSAISGDGIPMLLDAIGRAPAAQDDVMVSCICNRHRAVNVQNFSKSELSSKRRRAMMAAGPWN